jgi:hypothetical protein
VIYDAFSSPVTLVAYCGKHKAQEAVWDMVLLRIQCDGETRHVFMHTLKADGGLNEIHEAVDALPEVILSRAELRKALKEAE